VADLDLVATATDAVQTSAVSQFLVSHYHVVRPGIPKFMIQLVDPASRIRIDVFPDLASSIADARAMPIGDHSIRVLSLERILEHKLHTLSWASPAAPIDPKHVLDARALGAVLTRPVPSVAPEALAPDVYGVDDDGGCKRCALSRHPDWPLAPKDRIVGLLQWERQPNNRLQPAADRRISRRRG